MRRILLKVSAVAPLAGMLVPMIWSLFVPGYSSVSQHLSELEMLQLPIALATRIGGVVSGIGIVAFAIASMMQRPPRMPFTAFAALLFGAGMTSNGIFVMGSPLHGLYGIALFAPLVPAFFAAEQRRNGDSRTSDTVSLVAALLCMAYMWLMMSQLDPPALRGLTQRLAILPMFGWFAHASLKLLAQSPPNSSDQDKRIPASEPIGESA